MGILSSVLGVAGAAGLLLGGYTVYQMTNESSAWRSTVDGNVAKAVSGMIEASEALPGARLDKLLWRARTGSPEERKAAQETAKQLFGYNLDAEHMLTVVFKFDSANGPLHAGVRFGRTPFASELQEAAENRASTLNLQEINWSYQAPPIAAETETRIRSLITSGLDTLVGGIKCSELHRGCQFKSAKEDLGNYYSPQGERELMMREPSYNSRGITTNFLYEAISPQSKESLKPPAGGNAEVDGTELRTPWSFSMPPVLTIMVDAEEWEKHKLDFGGEGPEVTYWIHEKATPTIPLPGRPVQRLRYVHFTRDVNMNVKSPIPVYDRKILWASMHLTDEYFDPSLLEQYQTMLSRAREVRRKESQQTSSKQ